MSSISFYFDVASPYSYLAATQIHAIGARAGAEVHWHPFLLGGVFKATGNVPPAMLPARARYLFQDLQRWAEHYDVPFHFPSFFPINSILPMRALTALDPGAVPAAAMALFAAHWEHDRNPADPEVLVDILGRDIVARASEPTVKATLRAVTDGAVARGVFGAPTIFVGDQMFFGNDRLEFVARALQV